MSIIRRFALASAAFGMLSVLLQSEVAASENDNVNPSLFSPVEVVLIDYANNGCWTNFSESKAYAESKLEQMGYELGAASANKFVIYMNSARQRFSGLCFGMVEASLRKGAVVGGLRGWLYLEYDSYIFVGSENADSGVLELIDSLTNRIRTSE
ncbi:MAG: hypothetical protein L3J36_07145 [Rhodobacteraceae bacterium]|nr:hypothetical protein [Paracoccaceae bacterium]